MSLPAFLDVLRRASIAATPLEIAEALWLAQHLAPPLHPGPVTADQPAADVNAHAGDAVPAEADTPHAHPDQVPLATPSPSWRATSVAASPVRVPEPAGLAHRRDIQRALRPLRRRVPSRRRQDLDVAATVDYIARTGVWSPVMRPANERWFDVIVAVDAAASMQLWRHLAGDLRDVLVQTGAFRDVRVCRLNALDDGCTVEIGADRLPRSPRELIDGTGRRLFLVLTDGAAAGWHTGTATATLAAWGETGPVAVLQPLPEDMWSRTGLSAVAARLTSATAGTPNSQLRAVYRRRGPGMPVPVLGLEPAAVTAWAALVTHPVTDVPLAVVRAGAVSDTGTAAGGDGSTTDAVGDFRASASPEAFRLAVCLSLVPLSLPVMRLVQYVAVPRSGESALAEVVLGGLMTRIDDDVYEFRDGVRDRLAAELRRSDVATVLSAVSDWISSHAGLAGRTFPAVLGDGGDTVVAASPFAWVPPSVATRLSLVPGPRRDTLGTVASPGRPGSPNTLIAIATTERDGGPSPQALMAALRTAFRAAGRLTSEFFPLISDRSATVSTTVDVTDVVGRVFDYVGPALWAALGPSHDDFTCVRMAVHRLQHGRRGESDTAAVRRLQAMLESDTVAEAIGGRGNRAGLVISDEVHELLAQRRYPEIRAFRQIAPERAWLRIAAIAGIEVLPDADTSPGREHAVAADVLAGRRAELGRLADFAAGDGRYLWLQGSPGSGKTPLLKAFATSPPPAVIVRSLFLDGTADAAAVQTFITAAVSDTAGRRVVLLLDGIDDADLDLAAVLPDGSDTLGVIVSSRTGYQLPPSIPPDHPIRHCEIRVMPAADGSAPDDETTVPSIGAGDDAPPVAPAIASGPAAGGPDTSPDTSRARKAPVDVLIITALWDEYAAARDVLGTSQWQDHDPDGPAPYSIVRRRTGTGETMTVALTRPIHGRGRGVGPITAALIERLQPTCVAMCGVCAGHPDSTAPGDVIVATPAYQWEEGARARGLYPAGPGQFPQDARWVQAVQDFDPAGLPSHGAATDDEAELWLLECLEEGRDPHVHPARARYFPHATWASALERMQAQGLTAAQNGGWALTGPGRAHLQRLRYITGDGPAQLPFAVLAGPMASGTAVMTDRELWSRLQVYQSRTLALDTEAATIAAVAHDRQVPHWLVAKGVIDHGGADNNDRFKRFAARASAEVLLALLRTLMSTASRTSTGLVSGLLKMEVVRRLGDDWQDLADAVGVPAHETRRFHAGEESRELWKWLETRDRLGELPQALDEIGRTDLAERLRRYRLE